MATNLHKRLTEEDRFARKYYCTHARLNSIRNDKKQQKSKLRQLFKNEQNKDTQTN